MDAADPLNNPFANLATGLPMFLIPNLSTDPATGITAIALSAASKYFSRAAYIIAFIISIASPITGISPAQSNTVCTVSTQVPPCSKSFSSTPNVISPFSSVNIPCLLPAES